MYNESGRRFPLHKLINAKKHLYEIIKVFELLKI